MSLARLVGMLARACIFLMKRDAARTATHRYDSERLPVGVCDCVHCQWVRGIEAEGDEVLGAEWKP